MGAEFGIAHLGLPEADALRLRTIVGVAVANRSVDHQWRMSGASDADLVVVGADSAAGLAAAAASDGKRQIFAVLAGESDAVPQGCLRLPWPIRQESVLSLLKTAGAKVAKSLAEERRPTAPGDTGAGAQQDLVKLASILRDSGGGAGTLWRIDGVAKRPLYLSLAEKVFFFGESLMELRDLNPTAKLGFVPIAKEEISLLVGRKPIVMLQWLVGLRTGGLGLLPWIDGTCSLRLSRYPEFQMLHHQPAHRRIAAALSRPRAGVAAVAAAVNEDVETVTAFVNAVSLCGYLRTIDRNQAAAASASAAPARPVKSSLIASFRKALGISGHA